MSFIAHEVQQFFSSVDLFIHFGIQKTNLEKCATLMNDITLLSKNKTAKIAAIPAGNSALYGSLKDSYSFGSPREGLATISIGPNVKGVDLEPESTRYKNVTLSKSEGCSPSEIATKIDQIAEILRKV